MELHCLVGNNSCIFYRRYIDDVFAIFGTTPAAQSFISKFQSLNQKIQFEAITISRSGVFLDIEVSISDLNILSTKVFQKALNKYLYLPPFSAHDRSCMSAVIKQELIRYRLLCSNDDAFHDTVSLFKQRLLCRGYSLVYLDYIFSLLPNRADILARLATRIQVKTGTRTVLSSPGPVITLYIPPLHRSNLLFLKNLFTIPDELVNLPEYKHLFQLSKVIFGKKYFNSIGKFLVYKKFLFLSETVANNLSSYK
jgi:hypothetical protein